MLEANLCYQFRTFVPGRGRTVLCEVSEALGNSLSVVRPLSHVLTLHVEKGGQRRTHSHYFLSPNLMIGWREEIEAEEGKKDRKE